MIWPVVAYAPTAATMPSIAAQPLNLSASLFMCLLIGWICVFVLNAVPEVTLAGGSTLSSQAYINLVVI